MSAVGPLIAAALLLHVGAGWPWLVAASVILAAAAGMTFPDLDTKFGLGHRSGLLHGVWPSALIAMEPLWWPVAAGLALGIGVHLAADLFPSRMRGYATIKLPLLGGIGAGGSYLWIAANAAASLMLGVWLLAQVAPARVAAWAFSTVSAMGTFYLLRTQGGWRALAMFAGLGWLAMRA